jgi:hypothetical protein
VIADRLGVDLPRLGADHRGHHRLVLEPRGVERPRHVLLGADDRALHVERAGRQERSREERREDPRPLHPLLPHVVADQRRASGLHDRASAARDEPLERGGEGRMPDHVGQVDHLTLEDRP